MAILVPPVLLGRQALLPTLALLALLVLLDTLVRKDLRAYRACVATLVQQATLGQLERPAQSQVQLGILALQVKLVQQVTRVNRVQRVILATQDQLASQATLDTLEPLVLPARSQVPQVLLAHRAALVPLVRLVSEAQQVSQEPAAR